MLLSLLTQVFQASRRLYTTPTKEEEIQVQYMWFYLNHILMCLGFLTKLRFRDSHTHWGKYLQEHRVAQIGELLSEIISILWRNSISLYPKALMFYTFFISLKA